MTPRETMTASIMRIIRYTNDQRLELIYRFVLHISASTPAPRKGDDIK